jgi:colanic acid biosynthesis protein WcaH
MLNREDFKHIVQNAPLFALDLVLMNPQGELLLGQRKNAPAKGFWFVPGGRVFKNESLEQAFLRISQAELGFAIAREQAKLLGLFDHFYADSALDPQVSTHYINATHLIRLSAAQALAWVAHLPPDQHAAYRWLHWQALESDASVHPFSKVFLTALQHEI